MPLWEHMSAEDFSACSWALGSSLLLLTEVQQADFGSATVLLHLLQLCSSCAVTASAGEGPSDLSEKKDRLVPLKSEYDKGWKTSDMQKRVVLKKICIMNEAPCACEKEYAVIKR